MLHTRQKDDCIYVKIFYHVQFVASHLTFSRIPAGKHVAAAGVCLDIAAPVSAVGVDVLYAQGPNISFIEGACVVVIRVLCVLVTLCRVDAVRFYLTWSAG